MFISLICSLKFYNNKSMKNDFVASTIRNHHHHQMSGNYEASEY